MHTKNKFVRASSALIIIFLLLSAAVTVSAADEKVTLGGMPFGVTFLTGEIKIGGFDDVETDGGKRCPAREAGLCCHDVICTVDGKAVASALDVTKAVKAKGGEAVSFTVKRKGAEVSVTVTPVLSKETGEYRLGIWLEEGAAGLGTVTYIKETGEFGGLGHGIVNSETGAVAEIQRGVVSEVTVSGVKKGVSGEPGELRGDFLDKKLGVVTKNTDCGVFGVLADYPFKGEDREIEIGSLESVKDGGASIYCTVDGGGICEYAVQITRIDGESEEKKNFLITVTDTALIEKTGGIVRGMSGSPVIQNGKLVGAVTHVLVNDPTKGYGIFIENMLDAAK